ncbi:ABC transporter ATP-binding protein [Youngiibacter fragilis]|uniref:ABC transporter ATP-binding protein n=1 Tax=Youngiibacter fragilis 232.1 TaxID=994573 RepID=V7I7X5_9CLOT|nr:ABC transporter ATP-binding protein [Youngiibacter fragilis 232.1]
MIEVKGLTLTYPSGKGVFDLDFKVEEGILMGYLGPNGAGKTTTIRALLGFMDPDRGSCSIGGLDCTKEAAAIQKTLGYIPGEITFLEDMSGAEFLRFMGEMRGTKDNKRQKQLLEMFELDPKGKIRKFSKGMKQKLAIVTALMHDPKVLILDEPTSGLDPLMQNRFLEVMAEEKAKGKTILMSSHIFEEVEKVCDNVLIIKDGRIVKQADVQTLKDSQRKGFSIRCAEGAELAGQLKSAGFEASLVDRDRIEVIVTGENVDSLIKTCARFKVIAFDARNQSLEDIFMQYYGKEGK